LRLLTHALPLLCLRAQWTDWWQFYNTGAYDQAIVYAVILLLKNYPTPSLTNSFLILDIKHPSYVGALHKWSTTTNYETNIFYGVHMSDNYQYPLLYALSLNESWCVEV
jgi:hypothetical protein